MPDDGERFAIVGWKQWSDLLGIQEFADADYAGTDERWSNGKKSYKIHRAIPIKDGGRVNDMSNMTILIPRMHDYILPREAHYGPGRKR